MLVWSYLGTIFGISTIIITIFVACFLISKCEKNQRKEKK